MIELGFEFRAMACPCALRLAGHDTTALHAAAASAIAEVRRIENKYSRYEAASVVSRINAAAGKGDPIEVDDETACLLDFAANLYALSDGLFDITSGVLRRAWDFRSSRLPDQRDIEALLPLVGWPQLRRQQHRVALQTVGMEVDFGGFGKEYAADRAAAVLLQLGVQHGYVSLGGDIRVFGPRADGSGWRLGIRHPRLVDELLETLELAGGALATSGDYERFIEVDGDRYCHVLDPRSGWPVQHWRSISVVAPTCAAAGAACTIALLMGERALVFLAQQRLPFVAVGRSGDVIHG